MQKPYSPLLDFDTVRAIELLKAARDLLNKQKSAPVVLDMLRETVFYDGVYCDGYCLIDDIDALLAEVEE